MPVEFWTKVWYRNAPNYASRNGMAQIPLGSTRLDSTHSTCRAHAFGCVELVEEHSSSRSTRSSRLARLARQSRTCRVESSGIWAYDEQTELLHLTTFSIASTYPASLSIYSVAVIVPTWWRTKQGQLTYHVMPTYAKRGTGADFRVTLSSLQTPFRQCILHTFLSRRIYVPLFSKVYSEILNISSPTHPEKVGQLSGQLLGVPRTINSDWLIA